MGASNSSESSTSKSEGTQQSTTMGENPMATDPDSILRELEHVARNASNWRKLSWGEKESLLRECLTNCASDCDELSLHRYAAEIAKAQSMVPGTLTDSESKLFAFVTMQTITNELRQLADLCHTLETTGLPPKASNSRTFANGSIEIHQVYPLHPDEKKGMLTPGAYGLEGELWTLSGAQQLVPKASSDDNDGEPSVTIVLGAGNYELLGFVDVLDRMVLHNEVVVLKHHPLRGHLRPIFDFILSPIKKLGFYASFVDIDLATTQMMIYHPMTKHIHLTGGGPTHDGIIGGAPNGYLRASFTSELGCVTPWIVASTPEGAPNGWTDATLKRHAYNLVNAMKANGSASCNAPKALILDKSWGQKDAFLTHLRSALANIKCNPPYYPGHQQRFESFLNEYKTDAEIITTPIDSSRDPSQQHNVVRQALLHVKLGPGNTGGNRFGLRNEAFCPCLAIVELETDPAIDSLGDDSRSFLKSAAAFVNEECFGSLSCTILATPAVSKAALDEAIGDLKYGSVCVNAWTAIGSYGCPNATWGAYPGLYRGKGESGSGSGVVKNHLLFDESKLLKSVTRVPFVANLLQNDNALPPSFVVEMLYETTRRPNLSVPQILWILGKAVIGVR